MYAEIVTSRYIFMLHIKTSHLPQRIKVKKNLCPNKPMQTYLGRLLSTWFSNRYSSVFNVTASTQL